MRLTRKQLVAGAAAGAALGAAGVYELVDQLSAPPRRRPVASRGAEQHLLQGAALVEDNGVEVLVPPLHHQVVTAELRVGDSRAALRAARAELEEALAALDDEYDAGPDGLRVAVAWGLPYFRRYVPKQAEEHLPIDRRASKGHRERVFAVIDAQRFPSDPEETILEENEVAVLFNSDRLENVEAGAKALFQGTSIFRITSIRKGFAGGGFLGSRSLPKKMALAAGVKGAELIPETAELFLGFTSSQKQGLGPGRITNFETLGLADVRRSGYFHGGTAMHLSHIFEELEQWYLDFDFGQRVETTFNPRIRVPAGTQTVRQGPDDVASEHEVVGDFRRKGVIGHSAAIQTTSRLRRDTVGDDGTVYPRGTAIPQRADFNTLDNPFFWSALPARDGQSDEPAAGIHFVVFNPTSDDFRRNRLAMDGVLPDGTKLALEPRSRGQGINAVLRTTHRQNFLVPPRRHRSFPLVDLRA